MLRDLASAFQTPILCGVILALEAGWLEAQADDAQTESRRYESPYRLQFTYSHQELFGDLEGPRGNPQFSSTTPYDQWYSEAVRRRYGTWGPRPRHYPAPHLPHHKSDYLRQRVLGCGLRFEGYPYQHHHLPDWDPPADWPWSRVAHGHNSKGVDCSNFTAFVYNLALGLKPTSDCVEQSRLTHCPGPGEGRISPIRRIELPEDRAALSEVLKPADLLFIRGREDGPVTHVVLWVGEYGVMRDGSPSSDPLILDSHGQGVRDTRGESIPDGIYLRPFRAGSWYARCASHALRLLPE